MLTCSVFLSLSLARSLSLLHTHSLPVNQHFNQHISLSPNQFFSLVHVSNKNKHLHKKIREPSRLQIVPMQNRLITRHSLYIICLSTEGCYPTNILSLPWYLCPQREFPASRCVALRTSNTKKKKKGA